MNDSRKVAEEILAQRNGHAASVPPDIGDKGLTKALADAITENEHFAVDVGGKLYRYSAGAYRSGGEKFIKRRVKELLEAWGLTKSWSSYRASEVTEYLKADARELWTKPPSDEINVQNGILNLYTKTLRDHTPEYLSATQIPVKFDQAATCAAWEQYVVPCFPSDAPELPYEIAANIVAPYKANQLAVLLCGEGDNGKSTYLSALLSLLGSANATNMSLHRLETDRFSVARLVGKLANICPDLPSSHLNDTSIFKALTGDEAQLTAEYKHKDSFEFEPFAKLVFSANHPPRSSDSSHAFFRRWLVAPFERTFTDEEKVPREELDAKLTAKEELSGVLNKVLEVLPRVRSRGFTESTKMRKAWEEFRQATDPVSVWLSKTTVTGPDAYVSTDVLVNAYNTNASEHGQVVMNKTSFTQALKRIQPEVEVKQRTYNGKLQRCYVGIGLKGSDPDDSGGGDPPEPRPPEPPRGAPVNDLNDFNDFSLFATKKLSDGETEEKTATSCNKKKVVKPVKPVNGRGHTEEQEREVERLVREGMSREWAEAAVRREMPENPDPPVSDDEVGGAA